MKFKQGTAVGAQDLNSTRYYWTQLGVSYQNINIGKVYNIGTTSVSLVELIAKLAQGGQLLNTA